ncbi:hypothetical protein SK128_014447 [Halocaridina rubra]|uniref:Uncharacterized protein n=1 Tax=Halocaridina rubra TaxID=373956 RepID=A0AAN8WFK1_HALRR
MIASKCRKSEKGKSDKSSSSPVDSSPKGNHPRVPSNPGNLLKKQTEADEGSEGTNGDVESWPLESEDQEEEDDEDDEGEGEWSSESEENNIYKPNKCSRRRKNASKRGSVVSTNSGCVYSSSCSATSLRVAIKTSGSGEAFKQDLKLSLSKEALDSGRETLGRPQSPISPCLLTPNIEFPSRPQYDLTGELDPEENFQYEENYPSWTCDCFKDSSPISKEKLKVISKISDEAVKNKLLRNMIPGDGPLDFHHCLPISDPNAHRRSLHLHLQGDNNGLEDDLESLDGDIGEGYRRPHSEPIGDIEKECHRQISSETVLSLPVVSLQLPGPPDLRGCQGRRYRRSSRKPGEGQRRNRQGISTRRTYRDVQKPKLVTVNEVHRRAREERKKQRETLAAAIEMAANQRIKSDGELEAWREEARQMQQQQQQHYSLHPDSYLRAVCEAPFAVDGTMLTPRARAKLKPRDNKSSRSPSVSDVTGVCAGVRKCLDELSQSSKSTAVGGAAGVGHEEGPLSHTASLVHQLTHLRRQLNRLRVNCVI